MSTNINFRAPKQLLADFEKACQKNYTNKSEVLRRAMLDYVRQNQKGEPKVYKAQSVKYKEGMYVPGTEVTLCESDSLEEALAVLDTFDETEDETAIVVAFMSKEEGWQIIREK